MRTSATVTLRLAWAHVGRPIVMLSAPVRTTVQPYHLPPRPYLSLTSTEPPCGWRMKMLELTLCSIRP